MHSMCSNNKTGIVFFFVIIVGVLAVGFAAGSSTVQAQSDTGVNIGAGEDVSEVDVKIDGADKVRTGEPTELNVSVVGAQTGVSAYELTFNLTGSDAAVFKNVNVTTEGSDGPLTDIEYNNDNQQVHVEVATLDAEYQPNDIIKLVELSVSSPKQDSASVEITRVEEMKNTDIQPYIINNTETKQIEFSDTTNISVDEPNINTDVNTTETVNISVENPTNGISSFDMGFIVGDKEIATIDNVSIYRGDQKESDTSVTYANNKTQADVNADLFGAKYSSTESTDIVRIKLNTSSIGTTKLKIIDVKELADVNSNKYNISAVTNSTIKVETDAGEDTNDDDIGNIGDIGGGGGGSASDSSSTTEQGPPTIAAIRSTLDLVEPTTQTQPQITDTEPDTSGITVEPDGTRTVNRVSFEQTDLSGEIAITEYSDPPETVRTDIKDSAMAAGAVGAESDDAESNDGIDIVAVSDIAPTTDQAEEAPATVEFTVPKTAVDNPQQLSVVHETYSFEQQAMTWEQLATTVSDASGETVTVTAETDGFSLFAVTETAQPSQSTDESSAEETDGQDSDGSGDSGVPLPAIAGILIVVVVAVGAYYRKKE